MSDILNIAFGPRAARLPVPFGRDFLQLRLSIIEEAFLNVPSECLNEATCDIGI